MFKNLPKSVKIVEVGPRDGLQNEKIVLSTEDKFTYIKKLLDTGLKTVEITSFVSPKAIPQMADSIDLYKRVKSLNKRNIDMPCLVPNLKGFENALDLGVSEIALFTATSSEFTKKNINTTVDESFQNMKAINDLAKKNNIKVRGYISTAFGCPYKGDMDAKSLVDVVKRFKNFDLDELSIGDTIGVATPSQVDHYLKEVVNVYDREKVAMHFHDTRGMALSNILVSLERNISIFDASSGGLGGCPYAKGATGNVATEDLIYLLDSLDIAHGVDFKKLVEASRFILGVTGKQTPSKYLTAYLKSLE
jgi:hydroxymethylglutaryl-CoA lyase